MLTTFYFSPLILSLLDQGFNSLYNFRDSSDPINCSVYSDALSEYNRSYDALAEFMQDDERMTDFAVNGDLGVLF